MSRADESRAGTTAAAIIVSPAIALVAMALRIYTRRVLVGVRFVEDYCIVFAMVFSITMSVFMGIVVVYGFGRHIETISASDLVQQGKFSLGGAVFYIMTHLALKLSILLQYVRISVMSFEKWLCYAIIVVLIGQSFAFVGTHLGLCRPFHALWTPNVPGAVCLDRTKVIHMQLGMTIAMDFLVLLAPLFILRHLRLPWTNRLCILIVLSFGGMACIISIVRLSSVLENASSTDSTYDKVGSAIYGAIEVNLGIFCACIVTLKPLFNRFAPFMSQRLGLSDRDSDSSVGQGSPNGDNANVRRWPTFRRFAYVMASDNTNSKSTTISSGEMSNSMSEEKPSVALG
ncbi:hypothetical protein QBC40DRAFT_347906 [Triangularia verruculosa]|uniref:Rhodopsin domain-containing protein n=1 Tax=Triangularia verruculosa TaxID=2587418 RepID=A0AAN6XP70_9PEZI|nr:hypothetical protein QBC40DRAFT_347906 [Triangularia verruculosa]